MSFWLLSLLRAFITSEGRSGEFLSLRRKSHRLEAEWYVRLAAAGEKERREPDSRND